MCVSRARAFRPCWPCRLSSCACLFMCVCVCVRGCASIFGAQKAQRTLKDTWPALTATPTATERQRTVCTCAYVYAWRTRCLGLSSSSALHCVALPCALPLQAALALAATAVFCCQLANAQLLQRCDTGQRRMQRSAVEIRKTDNGST